MPLEKLSPKVFSIEELLDKILGYAIHSNDGEKVSTADVRSCRLVNKSWLRATSGCLRKFRTPLFHLDLNKDNSVNGTTFVCENGKLLEKFVNTVTGPSRLDKKIPPFKIKAHPDFFREENYESLLDCFSRCGGSLVDLDIKLPGCGGSMTFAFPQLSFPKLQCFTVKISDATTTQLAFEERIVGGASYFYLMEKIFSGCKELKKLKVKTMWKNYLYCFERLVLPATISELKLFIYDLKNKNLEHLLRSDLPNLQELVLYGCGVECTLTRENVLIYKLLDKFRNQLTQFQFYWGVHHGPPKNVTYFQLPVMNELEVFGSASINLELDLNASVLQNKLPKLQHLWLRNQTVPMFRKWIENSNFTSVIDLEVSLVDENFHARDSKYHVSLSSEMVLRVKTTFPNLQILEITVCGTELRGLTCVFENLKRLRKLKVSAQNTLNIKTSDCWDALLIGIPVDVATVLRTTRTWNQVPYFKKGMVPSIRDLTELHELALEAKFSIGGNDLGGPLISDAVFQFAFLKMLRLTKLVLKGRFMVSSEAKRDWEDKGREIIYLKNFLN